jgi:hypothetical protein
VFGFAVNKLPDVTYMVLATACLTAKPVAVNLTLILGKLAALLTMVSESVKFPAASGTKLTESRAELVGATFSGSVGALSKMKCGVPIVKFVTTSVSVPSL